MIMIMIIIVVVTAVVLLNISSINFSIVGILIVIIAIAISCLVFFYHLLSILSVSIFSECPKPLLEIADIEIKVQVFVRVGYTPFSVFF